MLTIGNWWGEHTVIGNGGGFNRTPCGCPCKPTAIESGGKTTVNATPGGGSCKLGRPSGIDTGLFSPPCYNNQYTYSVN